MYYALTINAGQIITGVHESVTPILADTFEATPELADDTVVSIPSPAEYQIYTHILCYEEDGTLKDLVWCIENGYMELPQNKEIINGELVDKEIPAEEQPQTIKKYLEAQFSSIRQETAPTQKAARVMFRALAQTDVIKPADALDNASMFPLWSDHIGARAEAGSYWRHVDKLYRVNAGQGHTIQENWPPENAASLYSRVGNPAEEYPEFIQPTGEHNAYSKGDKFTYKGKRYIVIHPGIRTYTWNPETYPAGTREVT